ncbi:hypothetical protein [Microbacterium sulfonylureivorans]|uniref:hypothetical protein n=1 Tax=Microbacterium sulfonylureivorans TaxID=2486854 RepID=UPI000FD97FC5|nr:hypothetical protein [Microbacterium sulfonylureivorans]
MFTATPSRDEPARRRSAVAITTVTGLLVAGLVSLPGTEPRAAAAEPGVPETFLVSQTDAAASAQPYLTPDGQRAVFASTASDLVTGDANAASDVFLATAVQGSDDPFTGSPLLVSRPDASLPQEPADGPSTLPVASADGRYVAFLSSATNLTDGDHAPDARTGVYVRDTVLDTTLRVEAGGAEPLGDATSVDISDDGRYVAFVSDAPNLTAGDTNGVSDGFVADLDADGNGVHGDVGITRIVPDRSLAGGVTELVLSGNGAHLAFTTGQPLAAADPVGSASYLYRGARADAGATFALVAAGAHDPAMNGSGEVIVYIADAACAGHDTIIASTFDLGDTYYVALATNLVEFRSGGTIASPTVSADGSGVAWETTRPRFSFAGIAPVLPAPVVRTAVPDWAAAATGGRCSHSAAGDFVDLGTGSSPSLSASARTVAFSGPSALAPSASAAVLAVDTHRHDGLAVSSTLGELTNVGYMAAVDIAKIPVSALQGYAAALADAPIYRLPIYRLPIYRLPIYRLPIYRLLIEDSPIYRLPIYRLPIYRLDIPGGWPELLTGTPFADELVQSVTLADVLAWAEDVLADGSTATDAERAAAERIRSLTLSDVDLSDSGIDSLSLASIVLGGARLAQVPLPGTGTPLAQWQGVVDTQGLDVDVDEETILADLDAAGLDVGRSGIEGAVLSALPIASTLFDDLPMDRLFLEDTTLGTLDVAALSEASRAALFTGDVAGTLASNTGALRPEATVADLAAGAPAEVTFGTLLFSVLDAASYPWEQIAPTSIDPNASVRDAPGYGCDGSKRCGTNAQFSFTFDPGPGEPTDFAAPTASISLPAGTAPSNQYFASASGPSLTWDRHVYGGPIQVDRNLVRLPLADAEGGTSIEFEVWYTASSQPGTSFADAALTSGALSAEDRLYSFFEIGTLDDPANNRVGDVWEDPAREREPLQEGRIYYEWISPEYRTLDDLGNTIEGPALDEDYFLVDPPAPGRRLVISTNASDGQIALALFSPSATTAELGVAGAGPAPGTAVTEQTGDVGAPAEAGGDAAAPLAGHTLVDQAAVGGDGSAEIEAASTSAAPGEQMLLRVTSGNGKAGTSLYSLRARYVDEPLERRCAPWVAPQTADPGVVGVSDAVTASTNTVYLVDTRRFGDTHGAAAATQVRAALTSLTGTGHVGDGAVDGAVLSVDADLGVQAARTTLDANPCSMSARRALVGAINAYVSSQLGAEQAHVSSVVIVGGDDIVPLAPVAQHTAQFNEASHAASLRLTVAPDGTACPETVADGALDACATPLSAAAATNHILTDDPYGLADAYESLGGHLYVPTVGVGRLVETPVQITASIARFIAEDGMLDADSTLTGGYGAWAELPALVTENLEWRAPESTTLAEPWTRTDVESALFPSAGGSPRVVSINTHADETRMLPGIPGAEGGRFADADLLTASAHTAAPQLAGSLVFMIGCHAGGNLPTSYYGDASDWVDVFAAADGFIGNTGFGLANNVTTALGERLLGEYAAWIGTEVDGTDVSAAGALTYAKQSYLGGLGLYSGYDEKVLMEAVYYGLPMYAFSGTPKSAPLPAIPTGLSPVTGTGDGLSAASLTLTPVFTTETAIDEDGREVAYLTADGQQPLTVAGQPVLPRVVSQLNAAPEGTAPRGVLITGLTSERGEAVSPAVTRPSVGVDEPSASRAGVAFPSTFATVTSQQTPVGRVDLLVVTPGRVEIPTAGTGVLERFTAMDLEVIYAPVSQADGTPAETTAPVIRSVDAPREGRSSFRVRADGTGSDIGRVLLLAQPEGSTQWQSFPMTAGTDADGPYWAVDTGIGTAMRWIVQVADTAGNVATESTRGHLDPAAAPAPTIDTAAEPVALKVGERLVQPFAVGEVTAGERLTASFAISSAAGGAPVASGPMAVETGADGATRAVLDHVAAVAGTFTVDVAVCRGGACDRSSFPLTVAVSNTAPSASVELSADTAEVWPSSTLTATAAGADPDQDPVSLTYRWYVNGGALPESGSTLALSRWVSPGDLVEVTVTPNDGRTDGHVAHAEVLVLTEPRPPVGPGIVATAHTPAGDYVEGDWSTAPVTVTFTCSAGDEAIAECPEAVTVSADTSADGVEISGTVRDVLGATATDGILVRVDGTAPGLAPVVTPNPVALGATAAAAPRATDAASGIATQSCDAPNTATAGSKTLTCRATDVAGNSAAATASYTVIAPSPACRTGSRVALQPVNPDGSSVFPRISAIPVLFRLCDEFGRLVTAKGSVTGITQVSATALPTKGVNVNERPLLLPTVKPVYIPLVGLWAGSIGSATLKGGQQYTYRVDLADGTSFTFAFGIK